MIEEYYASKRPAPAPYKYTPPVNLISHKKETVLSLPHVHNEGAKGAPSAFEEARARKMGLSIEEYRKRVTIVSREQTGCRFATGDTVWPAMPEDVAKYGKCMVVGICRHYDDFGNVEWKENTPFLLAVTPLNDRTRVINCTIAWATKAEPAAYAAENLGDC